MFTGARKVCKVLADDSGHRGVHHFFTVGGFSQFPHSNRVTFKQGVGGRVLTITEY